jgi:hypothetical protein
LVYDITPSFINFPVSLKLKDIENQTNAILKGLIYEDKIIEDDNFDYVLDTKNQLIKVVNWLVKGLILPFKKHN